MATKQNAETNMSDAEKRGLVFMANSDIVRSQLQNKGLGITTLTLAPILIGLSFLVNIPPIVGLPLIATGLGAPCLMNVIANRIHMNKICKKYSNGKISYKDYKQLQKSGEIDKWIKDCQNTYEQEREKMLESMNGKNVEGTSLTAEEIAELKGGATHEDITLIEKTDETPKTQASEQATEVADDGKNVEGTSLTAEENAELKGGATHEDITLIEKTDETPKTQPSEQATEVTDDGKNVEGTPLSAEEIAELKGGATHEDITLIEKTDEAPKTQPSEQATEVTDDGKNVEGTSLFAEGIAELKGGATHEDITLIEKTDEAPKTQPSEQAKGSDDGRNA